MNRTFYFRGLPAYTCDQTKYFAFLFTCTNIQINPSINEDYQATHSHDFVCGGCNVFCNYLNMHPFEMLLTIKSRSPSFDAYIWYGFIFNWYGGSQGFCSDVMLIIRGCITLRKLNIMTTFETFRYRQTIKNHPDCTK